MDDFLIGRQTSSHFKYGGRRQHRRAALLQRQKLVAGPTKEAVVTVPVPKVQPLREVVRARTVQQQKDVFRISERSIGRVVPAEMDLVLDVLQRLEETWFLEHRLRLEETWCEQQVQQLEWEQVQQAKEDRAKDHWAEQRLEAEFYKSYLKRKIEKEVQMESDTEDDWNGHECLPQAREWEDRMDAYVSFSRNRTEGSNRSYGNCRQFRRAAKLQGRYSLPSSIKTSLVSIPMPSPTKAKTVVQIAQSKNRRSGKQHALSRGLLCASPACEKDCTIDFVQQDLSEQTQDLEETCAQRQVDQLWEVRQQEEEESANDRWSLQGGAFAVEHTYLSEVLREAQQQELSQEEGEVADEVADSTCHWEIYEEFMDRYVYQKAPRCTARHRGQRKQYRTAARLQKQAPSAGSLKPLIVSCPAHKDGRLQPPRCATRKHKALRASKRTRITADGLGERSLVPSPAPPPPVVVPKVELASIEVSLYQVWEGEVYDVPVEEWGESDEIVERWEDAMDDFLIGRQSSSHFKYGGRRQHRRAALLQRQKLVAGPTKEAVVTVPVPKTQPLQEAEAVRARTVQQRVNSARISWPFEARVTQAQVDEEQTLQLWDDLEEAWVLQQLAAIEQRSERQLQPMQSMSVSAILKVLPAKQFPAEVNTSKFGNRGRFSKLNLFHPIGGIKLNGGVAFDHHSNADVPSSPLIVTVGEAELELESDVEEDWESSSADCVNHWEDQMDRFLCRCQDRNAAPWFGSNRRQLRHAAKLQKRGNTPEGTKALIVVPWKPPHTVVAHPQRRHPTVHQLVDTFRISSQAERTSIFQEEWEQMEAEIAKHLFTAKLLTLKHWWALFLACQKDWTLQRYRMIVEVAASVALAEEPEFETEVPYCSSVSYWEDAMDNQTGWRGSMCRWSSRGHRQLRVAAKLQRQSNVAGSEKPKVVTLPFSPKKLRSPKHLHPNTRSKKLLSPKYSFKQLQFLSDLGNRFALFDSLEDRFFNPQPNVDKRFPSFPAAIDNPGVCFSTARLLLRSYRQHPYARPPTLRESPIRNSRNSNSSGAISPEETTSEDEQPSNFWRKRSPNRKRKVSDR